MIDPRHELAAALRQLAVLLTQSREGVFSWHPEGRHQRDALTVIRAGVAMLMHGADAERLAQDWAATGLVLTSNGPGSPNPDSSATERGALNGPDRWEARARQLRFTRSLLADNAHDYEGLVDLVTRVGERLGRVSSVESCSGCGRVITGIGSDRVRRIDGAPFCDACRKRHQRAS